MPRPRSSASSSTSTSTTGMPTPAKHMAMPPPIVPPPIMATFLMSLVAVSFGRSLILAARRSAKNMWRIAADSGDVTSSPNNSRSLARPSSIGRLTAASRQETMRSCAICPRARFANRALASSKNPASTVAGSIVMSRTRFRGAPVRCNSCA